MMGDVDFNSCCYYEYAALDVDQLRENLKYTEESAALVKKLVPVLLKTMAITNPSGKQNTFAGQIFPSLILIECKDDKIPLSYVNAFEKPVGAFGNRGIVEGSIEQLLRHVSEMDSAYQLPIRHRAWMIPHYDGDLSIHGTRVPSLPALVEALSGWMEEDQP